MTTKEKKGLDISTRSFIAAIAIIFILMAVTYVLTLIIPGGEYARITDTDGSTLIDTEAGFSYREGGIAFWKWLLSPILLLGTDGSTTVIAVIAFLLIIGGVFNSLDKSGLMNYMLDAIVHRFGGARYKLLAVVVLFFMGMGAFIGSFEECVPMVPIVVGLAVSLGWDALTGVGMSILAAGCGFSAGVCNPFTIGVAQGLAGLPMFSGLWLRILGFVLIYALLIVFLLIHARRVEKPLSADKIAAFVVNPAMKRGLICFVSILGTGVAIVVSSGFIPALQDYTMIIMAAMFLASGIISCLTAGMSGKRLGKTFLDGLISILPAVAMILMASSIKYTMEQAHILDTLLYYAVGVASALPRWTVILFIYLIVLVMNFFIASGSAKAFLLIPLIVPIAQVFGIPVQLCIVAFAFGDGFSNVFYPTNPVLLISLSLAGESYGRWAKWSWKFQTLNLVLTSLILLFGLAVGYGA